MADEPAGSSASTSPGVPAPAAEGGARSAADTFDVSKTLLALAGGLVVGVLAAVGVAGDLTARMVRNLPIPAAIPLLVLLLLGGWLLYRQASSIAPRSGGLRVTAIAVTACLVAVLLVGVWSQLLREQPSVSLQIEDAEGATWVTADGTGSGLRSNQRMLLQVVALSAAAIGGDLTSSTQVWERCGRVYSRTSTPPGVRLLIWSEAGPDADGVATVTGRVAVPAETAAVCAYVALVNPRAWYQRLILREQQFSWTFVTIPPDA